MISKAYRATRVNDVNWDQLARGKEGLGITLGVDVGKLDLWPVCRWADGRFERPWRVKNPEEIPNFVALIKRMSADRKLVVAMESSGTYGDALRQALADAKIDVVRVSNKASHDYAEVFDGVPSQHDGKDAAVVAELAALGKAKPWGTSRRAWEQELSYWVEWMVAHRQMLTTGRDAWRGCRASLAGGDAGAEALLGDVVAGFEALWDPKRLAADPEAAEQLARWGGAFLAPEKIERLVDEAGSSVGVRVGEWQQRQIQDYARQALAARQQASGGGTAVARAGRGNMVLQAQGKVVGVPTACVLWTSTGDPRNYHAAAPTARRWV